MAILTPEETIAKLDKEKKVSIRIRKDENNPLYETERVYVNGACIQIPVGEDVQVPATVAQLLRDRGII